MKTMTVRGIDPEMADALKKAAQNQGKSINQVALESIRSSLGLGKHNKYKIIYDDLDMLFGTWSDEDFKTIQGKIESERTIDQETWE